MKARGQFTVSGPGVDRDGYPSGPVALSAAITFAGREKEEATMYVRNGAGEAYGRVERHADSSLTVYGPVGVRS